MPLGAIVADFEGEWDGAVGAAVLAVDDADGAEATLGVRRATRADGDVAARVAVRFDETAESLRLVGAILAAMPDGEIASALPEAPPSRLAIGCAEGWRGPVFIALESGPGGAIRRCHPHDPSWQNWPVIEHAVIGNIVPDFPLINKSFNLSYSGHDL